MMWLGRLSGSGASAARLPSTASSALLVHSWAHRFPCHPAVLSSPLAIASIGASRRLFSSTRSLSSMEDFFPPKLKEGEVAPKAGETERSSARVLIDAGGDGSGDGLLARYIYMYRTTASSQGCSAHPERRIGRLPTTHTCIILHAAI